MTVDPAEPAERFARHTLIPGWDQGRLVGALVVVIGVGALGNEVSRILAMAGVGRLLLCDPDTVSPSNLSRTVLFRPHHVGRAKAEVAAEVLPELAADIRVEPRVAPLANGVGLAELRSADLVVSCLDSRAARIELATRCNLIRVGLLDGGTHPWGGEVRWYPAGGRCFGCWLTAAERAARDDPHSCHDPDPVAPVGASAPVSALVGAWLGLTAVRLLFGLPVPTSTLAVEGTGAVSPALGERAHRDPSCPLHEEIPPDAVTPLPVTADSTVADLLALLDADEIPLAWAATPGVEPVAPPVISPAQATTHLRDLGVAPREILAVTRRGHPEDLRFAELAAAGTLHGGV